MREKEMLIVNETRFFSKMMTAKELNKLCKQGLVNESIKATMTTLSDDTKIINRC